VPTLAEFVPMYLASVQLDNAFSTVETKENKLRIHVTPHLGHLRLDQIDYAKVDDLRVALAQTRNTKIKREVRMLKGKTINNVLDILGHVLDVARMRGEIAMVPRSRGSRPSRPRSTFSRSKNSIG